MLDWCTMQAVAVRAITKPASWTSTPISPTAVRPPPFPGPRQGPLLRRWSTCANVTNRLAHAQHTSVSQHWCCLSGPSDDTSHCGACCGADETVCVFHYDDPGDYRTCCTSSDPALPELCHAASCG